MDEDLLLDLLNTTPVVAGSPTDVLGESWVLTRGGAATELPALREVRTALQAAVRGSRDLTPLETWLDDVRKVPQVGPGGLTWALEAPPDRALAARAVLALAEVEAARPGRLRPCGNGECQLFFLDRSQAGRARWCSMAVCGNRMKARRHQRATSGQAGSDS